MQYHNKLKSFHLPASPMSLSHDRHVYMHWYHLPLPANPTCEPGDTTRLRKFRKFQKFVLVSTSNS